MSKQEKQLLKKQLIEALDLYAKLQARAKIAEKFDIPSIVSGSTEGMTPLLYEINRLKERLKEYA